MKQNECIQKILEEKNIKNYKIVSISEKKLVFKYSSGRISTEETKFDKINVFFNTEKGTSKIILLSTNTNDFIKKLIEDAIEQTTMFFKEILILEAQKFKMKFIMSLTKISI